VRARSRRPSLPPSQSEEALELSGRLAQVLASSGLLDLESLCLVRGRAVWCLALDVVCLSADGGLFDAALAAAVGALGRTALPAVWLGGDGRVRAVGEEGAPPLAPARRLRLRSLPASLTVGLYRGHVLVDPSGEEEALMHSLVTACVDGQGGLLAVHKPGGPACASAKTLLRCIAAASMRHVDVARALAAAGVEVGPPEADVMAAAA